MASIPRSTALRTLQPIIRSRADYQRLRFFTQRAQFLQVSRSSLRPQLPFLHNSRPRAGRVHARLARLLTTENRKTWKTNFWLFIKFYLLFASIRFCFGVITIGIEQSTWERAFPEPPDFSWLSKWWYRTARGKSHPGEKNVLVAWLEVGTAWKKLLARLEDPEIDGAGVIPRLGAGEDILVQGIGRTGLDISAKSETWRRGYWEALMGAAKTAEHLDTWVRDKTRNLAFPSEVVVGPSNPRPKPVPYGSQEAPKEEDCEQAFDEPQVFYMRILTTEGFTSRQRLDAALAYADFLQFKGLNSSALDMYDWAMDIAESNSHERIIDRKTGIIKENTSGITDNILVAASALAMHKAQTGDLAAALPVYLSILRAQRSLPPADPTTFTKTTPIRQPSTTWYGRINDSFLAPPYPEAPPTGDEIATRTPIASCNEAATMAHIGEILYASSGTVPANTSLTASKSQEAGLAWTRDAFDLAVATLQSMTHGDPLIAGPDRRQIRLEGSSVEQEAKTRCVECVAMAVENWKTMVRTLRKAECENKDNHAAEPVEQNRGWLWSSKSSKASPVADPEKWEREEKIVAAKEIELHKLLRSEGLQIQEF